MTKQFSPSSTHEWIRITLCSRRLPFEELSNSEWSEEPSRDVQKFCEILDEVTDNASYGWNPHLEDQVAWCVWSAPLDVQVAFRFHLLAEWLMHWDMNKEAEMALKKALHCGCHLLGSHDMNSIQTLVLISSVLWRQNRMEEALAVLQLAGEAFAKIDAKGSQCDAVRCFVKVAATYDALGWEKLAQDAWNRVSASI